MYVIVAVLITVANGIIVCAFRFLPLYDYPIWLYEIHIMHRLSEPVFSQTFELARYPVPNLGFVGIVYLLSTAMSIEMAGKILLLFVVVGLPWSFWYCVRRISGNPHNPLAYAAFPFAFSFYFFSGQAFLLGLIVSLLMMGFYLPKLDRLTLPDWTALSVLFVISFFIHALSFVFILITFGAVILSTYRRNLTYFLLSITPSVLCVVWYLSRPETGGVTEAVWSFKGVAQNIVKPLFLFTKSYAIANPFPLTILNCLWMNVLALLVYLLWRGRRQINKEFIAPFCVFFVLMIGLPEIAFGIVQPGGRFALPVFFLLVLIFSRAHVSDSWKNVFLAVAAIVTLYNAYHFREVNLQMREFFTDMTSIADMNNASFCSIRFDWPPERNWWDIGAASIDPLFGVPYYAGLNRGGRTWIFGTSLLHVKHDASSFPVVPRGSSPDELAQSLQNVNLSDVSVITLVGNNAAENRAHVLLRDSGKFHFRKQSRYWSILATHLPKN